MVRDTVAFLRAAGAGACSSTAEHFFDGYQSRPRLRRPRAATPRPRPAPTSASSATPTAACCPWAPRRRRHGGRRALSGSASTPRTTRVARWPTPWPRWMPARRTSRAPRTATASAPATPTSSASSAGFSSRWGGRAARGLPHRNAARGARDRRDRQPRAGHARALRRCVGLRAQGRPARVGDQGRPELYNHLDPAGGRATAADPRHRDGRAGPRSS